MIEAAVENETLNARGWSVNNSNPFVAKLLLAFLASL